jgi:hypothetical protein
MAFLQVLVLSTGLRPLVFLSDKLAMGQAADKKANAPDESRWRRLGPAAAVEPLQLLREFRHNSGALIAGRSNRRGAQRD